MKTTGVSCETKFGLLGFLGHPTPHVYMTSTGNLISFGKLNLVNYTSPVQPNFPRENLVWKSGQGEHSPKDNLIKGTKVKLPEGLCSQRPEPHQIARGQSWLHWTSLIY